MVCVCVHVWPFILKRQKKSILCSSQSSSSTPNCLIHCPYGPCCHQQSCWNRKGAFPNFSHIAESKRCLSMLKHFSSIKSTHYTASPNAFHFSTALVMQGFDVLAMENHDINLIWRPHVRRSVAIESTECWWPLGTMHISWCWTPHISTA